MKISEAIKFIVDQNDEKLLTDSKRFKSYLLDLCSDNTKELKIVKRALEDKILERIFGNERDNVKISRLRDEFEDQGMTTDWSEFVISSFAEALGWNYTPKQTTQQTQSKQTRNQLSNQTDWTCSCGTVNNGNFCGNCGKSKPVPKNIDWTCSCGTVNKTKFCTNCGKTEKQAIQQPKQVQEMASSIGNPFINAKVGDIVEFGNYPQSVNGDILPIEWFVLAKENNKMLVISRYGLDTKRFDRSSNDWKNSEIRQWLNSEFYNKAFTENEKKLIIPSSIFTKVYKGGFLGFGSKEELTESYDHIFLLNKEEAKEYFANGAFLYNNSRKCKATDYAKNNGAEDNDTGYTSWWLRSPLPCDISSVYCVDVSGIIAFYFHTYYTYVVARPALWINL